MQPIQTLLQHYIDEYSKDWHRTWPTLSEQQGLTSFLTRELRCGVVEIGCRLGRTSQFICDNLVEGKTLLCVDPFDGKQQGGHDEFQVFSEVLQKNKHKMLHVRETSQDKKSIDAMSTHSFSLCFVDGLHTYQASLQDLVNSYSSIEGPGAIIVDDTNLRGVATTMQEFLNNPKHTGVTLFRKDLQHNSRHKHFEILIVRRSWTSPVVSRG